jgi:myosin heavy subunit
MRTLATTEPHYIRCIKPNTEKSPTEFHATMCLEQLRYAGVFEAVRIRQSGFPFRHTHAAFLKRYRILMTKPPGSNDRERCMGLLQHVGMADKAGYVCRFGGEGLVREYIYINIWVCSF